MNQVFIVFVGLFCLSQSIYAQQRGGRFASPRVGNRGTSAQQREQSECQLARAKAQKFTGPVNLIPECEESGEYKGLQCHEKSKFCQCWKTDGTPITQPSTQIRECECIRQKHAAENIGNNNGLPAVGRFVPSCHTNGSFHPKQCHGSTGLCWCVDNKGLIKGKKVRGQLTCD